MFSCLQKFHTLTRPRHDEDSDYRNRNQGFVFGLKSIYHSMKHVHNPFYRPNGHIVTGSYVIDHQTNDCSHMTECGPSDTQYPGIVVSNMTYDSNNSVNNHVTNVRTNGDLRKECDTNDSDSAICPMVRVVSANGHVATSDVTSPGYSQSDVPFIEGQRKFSRSPPKYEDCI